MAAVVQVICPTCGRVAPAEAMSDQVAGWCTISMHFPGSSPRCKPPGAVVAGGEFVEHDFRLADGGKDQAAECVRCGEAARWCLGVGDVAVIPVDQRRGRR